MRRRRMSIDIVDEIVYSLNLKILSTDDYFLIANNDDWIIPWLFGELPAAALLWAVRRLETAHRRSMERTAIVHEYQSTL